MDKLSRVQRKRTKGWKMPENCVYVGRGSKWGNPYVIGKKVHECDGSNDHRVITRTLALNLWNKLMFPYSHAKGDYGDFMRSEANMRWIQDGLRGKNLACWCKLGDKCHADILLEIANEGIVE